MMMRIAPFLAVLLAGFAPSSSPVRTLAGRYSHHFLTGQVNGPDYWTDDVAEIVPIDAHDAYVRLELKFYNGHLCSIAGVAQAQSEALIYQGSPGDTFAGSSPCRLVVRRKGDALTWNDNNTCKAHCGERGSFMDGSLPWLSKRPITYLARLKSSREYNAALTEWRNANPVPGGGAS